MKASKNRRKAISTTPTLISSACAALSAGLRQASVGKSDSLDLYQQHGSPIRLLEQLEHEKISSQNELGQLRFYIARAVAQEKLDRPGWLDDYCEAIERAIKMVRFDQLGLIFAFICGLDHDLPAQGSMANLVQRAGRAAFTLGHLSQTEHVTQRAQISLCQRQIRQNLLMPRDNSAQMRRMLPREDLGQQELTWRCALVNWQLDLLEGQVDAVQQSTQAFLSRHCPHLEIRGHIHVLRARSQLYQDERRAATSELASAVALLQALGPNRLARLEIEHIDQQLRQQHAADAALPLHSLPYSSQYNTAQARAIGRELQRALRHLPGDIRKTMPSMAMRA